MLTVEQRVQRGIAYLDLFGPENWRGLVDPSSLQMSTRSDCVAGQVFGDYCHLPHFYAMNVADYGFMLTLDEEDDLRDARAVWYKTDLDVECPVWGQALHDEWVKQLSV